MGESLYGKYVEQSDADSGDSVAQRSSRDTSESIGPTLSSVTELGASVQRAPDNDSGPSSAGPDTRGEYEQRYGVDIDTPGQADRLQRLEESNTLETVQRWADEGMPIEAMGTPSKMAAFRKQKDTSVPRDIEHQNEASNRPNTSAIQRLQDTPAHVQRMQPGEGTSAMQNAPNRAPEHPTEMPSSQNEANKWDIDELIARIFGQETAEKILPVGDEADDRERMWEEAYNIDEYSEKTDNSYYFEEAMQLLEGGNEGDDWQRTSEKTDNIYDFEKEMQLLEGGSEEDDRHRILEANDRIYKFLLAKKYAI